MGAAVNMDSGITSKMERQRLEKAAPCRMARRRFFLGVLLPVMMLFSASEVVADGNVTMESITIFKTHEWFGQKPTVYFQCREEQKVYLPDVVQKNHPYSFLGQESWQPLTTLYGTKCKRCGIYEEDTVKADDTFYEWELCPKAFASPDGRYEVFQERQFNATLVCKDCIPQRWSKRCERCNHSMQMMKLELGRPLPRLVPTPTPLSGTDGETVKTEDEEEEEEEEKGAGLAFLIIVLVLVVLIGLGVVAYTKWRQKQRAEQQARFVKMFEDDDDLDAELGLKDDL